jgi:hypothetical protein
MLYPLQPVGFTAAVSPETAIERNKKEQGAQWISI